MRRIGNGLDREGRMLTDAPTRFWMVALVAMLLSGPSSPLAADPTSSKGGFTLIGQGSDEAGNGLQLQVMFDHMDGELTKVESRFVQAEGRQVRR